MKKQPNYNRLVAYCDNTVATMRLAARELRALGAPKAADAIARAVKSVDGARRNAVGQRDRLIRAEKLEVKA